MFWSIFWAAAFVCSITTEIATTELVAIWFMPGTLTAMILSFFDVDPWIQWTAFIVISAILLILAKSVFRKKFFASVGKEKTDTDLLIGKQAKVTADINNAEEIGAVKINGQIWSARMETDADTATEGEFVTVKRISGVKLICEKTEK